MVVVDAHCHVSPYWYEPIESALDTMLRNGVDKALLIPLTIGVYDPLNSYLLECMRRFPGRFSVVATVDSSRPDALGRLEEWVEQGVEGIRLRPTVRSPGSDPLAIWRKAAELGIVVSSQGASSEFGSGLFASLEFETIIKEFPNLKVIMEHLGGGRRDTAPYNTYRKVLELAQYPNTFMKVPGLGEICEKPRRVQQPWAPLENIPPLIEMAMDTFGAKRLMWGSDFPHVAEREGYGNCLRLLREHVIQTEEDREWIFGKTATTLFRFGK
jgi:L-fuconolactonase